MNDPRNIVSDYQRYRQARAKLNNGNKDALFDALAEASITEVHVVFDGGGDDGQINDVAAFRGQEPLALPKTTVTIQTVSWGSRETVTTEANLEEAIETICWGYLEETHDGWENNEGAYGAFRLDVAKRTIDLEFNGRYVDTWTSTHTF
jgi:hypothetical protein